MLNEGENIIFNFVFGNPPFQDNENRKKTQHKLWIEFTTRSVTDLLAEDGELIWISPSSWGSPSNKVFKIFKDNDVKQLSLDTQKHFPDIGSTFSFYHLKKGNRSINTVVKDNGKQFVLKIDESVKYFPNDFCSESIAIHKKVMFLPKGKMPLNYDYVTCHNVIRHKKKLLAEKISKARQQLGKTTVDKDKARREKTLDSLKEQYINCDITVSETKTTSHVYPLLHTNRKVWYSSIKQDLSSKKKVMWSRSGYTKPFYDDGVYGVTDMGYYILVSDKKEGKRLETFLNSKLMSYIFKTAKWSGFGNEIVFSSVPKIDLTMDMTDTDYYKLFSLTDEEIKYLENYSPSKAKKGLLKRSETRNRDRIKNLGEVFTPTELVREMLDCVSLKDWKDESKTFVDPACGNGNFVVEILKKRIDNGVSPITALSTVYGIDIMKDNVKECKDRIMGLLMSDKTIDKSTVQKVMDRNIICANTLLQND